MVAVRFKVTDSPPLKNYESLQIVCGRTRLGDGFTRLTGGLKAVHAVRAHNLLISDRKPRTTLTQ